MPLKKMVACLTTGLLMSFGATAENYRWDNVAMGGGGFGTGVIPTKSERGAVFARTDVGGAYRWDAQAGRWSALADWLSITRDSGWYVMDDFTTTAAATVPEPGTQLMLGIGLLALVAGRRRSAR